MSNKARRRPTWKKKRYDADAIIYLLDDKTDEVIDTIRIESYGKELKRMIKTYGRSKVEAFITRELTTLAEAIVATDELVDNGHS